MVGSGCQHLNQLPPLPCEFTYLLSAEEFLTSGKDDWPTVGAMSLAPTGTGPAPAPRVLVIDDEPGIRGVTSRVLGLAGFAVSLAATGRQGLSMALREPCDLVLLDLRLPDLGGEEILRLIRHERPRQAVLVCSATADGQAVSRCRSLGACGFLAKPFTLAELRNAISAHFPQPSAAF